jgi:hypothetical protein
MKILIRKSDNVVLYAQDDLILDTEAHGNGWRDPHFNLDNASLADAKLPDHWTGAVWSYTNGVWAVADTVAYAAIQAQIAAEAEAKRLASIPQSVTRAQAKLALLQSGLLSQVQPAIDGIADATQRMAAQIEWDDRLTFERGNGALVNMATMLGMTPTQIDDLFILAGTL